MSGFSVLHNLKHETGSVLLTLEKWFGTPKMNSFFKEYQMTDFVSLYHKLLWGRKQWFNSVLGRFTFRLWCAYDGSTALCITLLNFSYDFTATMSGYCKGRIAAPCSYSFSWPPWITLYHWLLSHSRSELISELVAMLNHIDSFSFPFLSTRKIINYS